MTLDEGIKELERAAVVQEGYIAIVNHWVPYAPYLCKHGDRCECRMSTFVDGYVLFDTEEECRKAIERQIERFNASLDETNEYRRRNGMKEVVPRSIDTYLVKILKVRYTKKCEVLQSIDTYF